MNDRQEVLGDAIKAYSPEIVHRWLEQIQCDIDSAGRNVELTDLRDGVGDYLERLADTLQARHGSAANGTATWTAVAREHALTRIRLGFDIEQLVHEFIVLRRSVMETIASRGVVLDATAAALLADLIEAAMATSVRSYVDSRDYQARQQEAEHIGFITHELRNPLATATLAATQLQNDIGSSGRSATVLGLLGKALRRMKDLIDRVLLTEQLEVSSVAPEITNVRIDTFMEESVRAARAEAQSKHLQFDVTYDPNLVVRADAGLATSALQNLADNAVKFTDEGHVRIAVEDRGKEVAFHVRDSCSGISAEELATIFEPFRRGHSGKPGTGLGLAIANRAIRTLGGRIEAESSHEDGCHFWMTLLKGEV